MNSSNRNLAWLEHLALWINQVRGRLSKEVWKDDVNYVPWNSVLNMFKELESLIEFTKEDFKYEN